MIASESNRLSSVARKVESVDAGLKVEALIEKFRHSQGVLAYPVVKDGTTIGMISRKELFYRHLAKPFARELYGRRAISELIEASALMLPAEMDINSGLTRLLQLDPPLENDCFGVESDGQCVGIVSVPELMMAIAERQSRLLEKLDQLNRRIYDEVEMARQVQQGLLPETPLNFGSVAVSGGLVNSTEISGDFYDVFAMGEGRVGLLVADATGHGVQAGLVTTAAKSSLKVLLDNGVKAPSRLLEGINRAICVTARGNLLMTALAAVIDEDAGTVRISSAGHPFPYGFDCHKGYWEGVELEPGLPLGFDEQLSYSETEICFRPGDKLVMFSDGIVEAENSNGLVFGESAFEALLDQKKKESPQEIMSDIIAEARLFVGKTGFEDDVTLVVAGREEQKR